MFEENLVVLRVLQILTTAAAVIVFIIKAKGIGSDFWDEFPWLVWLLNMICFYTVIFINEIFELGIRHTYGISIDPITVWSSILRLHLLGTLLAYTLTNKRKWRNNG